MNSVRMRRVREDDAEVHEAVLEVLRRGFVPFEAVCMMSGVAARPEDADAFLDVARVSLKDGTSVVAYRNGVLVGAAVNFTMYKSDGEDPLFGPYLAKHAHLPSARWLGDFIEKVYSNINEFTIVGASPLLELVFLVVLSEAGHAGIGRQLVEETMNVAKQIGAKGVSSTFTSDRSWAAARKLGFQELAKVDHALFLCGDKPASELLPAEQQSSVVALCPF